MNFNQRDHIKIILIQLSDYLFTIKCMCECYYLSPDPRATTKTMKSSKQLLPKCMIFRTTRDLILDCCSNFSFHILS